MSEVVANIRPPRIVPAGNKSETSQQVLRRSRANELFIAVVAPAGAGAGTAAKIIKGYLELERVNDQAYVVEVVKASDKIKKWAQVRGVPVPRNSERKTLDDMVSMQDAGDEMRLVTHDNAAVARAIVTEIRKRRSVSSNLPEGELDGKPRAYIIDSLRHPAEAHLLRSVYQEAFTLVGVVCDPTSRDFRLRSELFKYADRNAQAAKAAVANFMERDADAPQKHGQHVTDTFHEADFFVDNSHDEADTNNSGMNEPLRRLVKLLTSTQISRPTVAESAMHHAHSAQLRSACLSRQVGAALVDEKGDIVATGANEVPKAGGGVYVDLNEGEGKLDDRCAFRETKYCSNNKEQTKIIESLIEQFPVLINGPDRKSVIEKLRRTRIGGLIEFSRAVHAEMDTILSAARVGVSPRGGRLFVTTFPCHYCARHIVSAGIDEVQYIEPYPKSQALALHCDSITVESKGWVPPSMLLSTENSDASSAASRPSPKVLFRPFVGVAPRMYSRVFRKDRDYKNKETGEYELGEPDWGGPSDIFRVRYTELEGELGNMGP